MKSLLNSLSDIYYHNRYLLFMMKLTILALFLGLTGLSASTYSQNAKLSLNLKNVSINEVLKSIEKQSEFVFIYENEALKLDKKISITVKKSSVDKILSEIFKDTGIDFEIRDRQIIITKKTISNNLINNVKPKVEGELQQPKKKVISGLVKDTKGMLLTGATVMVKGTTIGQITDAEGRFKLSIPVESRVLVISFMGMKSQEVPIMGKLNIEVTLQNDMVVMNEEVVVVGYGTQKKTTVTGAIASIGSAKLVQSPVSNLSNALGGRVSGLLTTQSSGAPGQDQTTLRIRGVGTFSGTTDPLIMVDGIEAQSYNNIDPNEIENISVLKDASATAVYGVRGANGVLIITTKRGQVGKPQVSFTSQFAVSKFAEMRKYAGSAEYAQGYNDALQYDSYLTGVYIPKYSASDIQHYINNDDPLFHPNSDWISKMFKPSTLQTQQNLNISGGTEKVKYFFSFGYLNQDGLFNEKTYDPGYDAKTKYERYNFRSNFDFNITKRLTAKLNLSSQIENRQGPTNVGLIMSNTFAAPPTVSPGVWDGKIVNIINGAYYANPLPGYFGLGLMKQYGYYLNGTIRFDYDLDFIVKGLSTHASITYQNYNSVNTNFSKTLVQYNAISLPDNKYALAPTNYESPYNYGETYGKRRKQDEEFGFDFSRKFGAHNLGGLLMYNQSKTFDPTLAFVVPNGYQGVVGRATYSYSNRYLAEFNFGYNGTENFAPGKRFGFFPAYSLGWVASEESFFPKNNIVSFVKFRGSYGEVGNDKIGGDRFLYRPTTYGYSGTYNFGEVGSTFNSYNRSNEGKIGNPYLTWERAKKLDIGADIILLKDKIRISADYFDERRDNILANRGTTPDILGAILPAYNLGKMRNGGFDGEINFNSKVGKLNYWLKGVFTFTHNVIEFQDEVKGPYAYQNRTGQRYGQAFGYVVEGIYNTWAEVNDVNRPVYSFNSNKIQPGDFKYKDVNGDGIIDGFDQVPIGYSPFPGQTFGLSFGADFKGFDFSVLFQGSGKYTHSTSKKFNRGWQEDGSAISYLLDRSWTWEKYQAGIATDFPHISSSASQISNYQSNTFWQENAQYVRLKNVEIGYTLKPALLKKFGIGSVRLYLNGNNLLTWSNLFPGEDPEIPNYSEQNNEPYPITQTFNCGINVKF